MRYWRPLIKYQAGLLGCTFKYDPNINFLWLKKTHQAVLNAVNQSEYVGIHHFCFKKE